MTSVGSKPHTTPPGLHVALPPPPRPEPAVSYAGNGSKTIAGAMDAWEARTNATTNGTISSAITRRSGTTSPNHNNSSINNPTKSNTFLLIGHSTNNNVRNKTSPPTWSTKSTTPSPKFFKGNKHNHNYNHKPKPKDNHNNSLRLH